MTGWKKKKAAGSKFPSCFRPLSRFVALEQEGEKQRDQPALDFGSGVKIERARPVRLLGRIFLPFGNVVFPLSLFIFRAFFEQKRDMLEFRRSMFCTRKKWMTEFVLIFSGFDSSNVEKYPVVDSFLF